MSGRNQAEHGLFVSKTIVHEYFNKVFGRTCVEVF